MLEIIVIRPGSTDYDQQGRIQGTLDIPLNDEGRAEVARAAEELKTRDLQAIYTAESLPAVETAEALAGLLGVKLKRLEALTNLDLGLWQGLMIDEVKHKQPKVYRQWQEHPESVCPPNGERFTEALERVQSAIAKMFRKHSQGVVALVAPEPLASIARRFLRREEMGNLWKNGVPGCAFDAIPIAPEGLAAVR